MKKVSIITINYNSGIATEKFLRSLEKVKISGFELEIIVIDNGSEKAFKTSDNISVIRSDTNNGFTGGCNIGIKKALKNGADYVLLINNDTTVHPILIKNLIEGIEDDDKIGIATPKIYFSKGHEFHKDKYKKEELGQVIWFAGGVIDWKNAKSVHRGMDEVDRGQYEILEKIEFATGCCMLIKKEVFEKVGLFDEKYFLYYEDADLCERVKKAGFDIHYVPKGIVYHDNAGSSGSGSSLHDYFLTRNQMIFGMKYAPLKTKIALVRQSLVLLASGRKYQKKGIKDYYLHKFGKGTYFEHD
ncbi:MAG TPA: glycosyltransferase family 2 protein [Candidatus Limnocylindrales bacterium]|nr:glycosyltransferase family 2 protein [Candidatus Limnocylindrales bacterium]